jgi:hypothetical protein
MAGDGVFIGWGEIIAGRERQSRQVFGEALGPMVEEEKAGNVESHEVVLLQAHGGGLAGFMLMRGDREKLHGVVTSPRFQRLVSRAEFIVHEFGVLRAVLDDNAVRMVGTTEEATADLA